MKLVLANGMVVLFDKEDAALVKQYTWHAVNPKPKGRSGAAIWYAQTGTGKKTVYMHRLIMGFPKGLQIDHCNDNGLDNRRSNLRLATASQNTCRKRKAKGTTSKYRGVTLEGASWKAQIKVNYKNTYLGRFSTEEEAAAAYDRAALLRQGDFARLNFPEKCDRRG